MILAGIKEIKNNLSRFLAYAQAREEVVITKRGPTRCPHNKRWSDFSPSDWQARFRYGYRGPPVILHLDPSALVKRYFQDRLQFAGFDQKLTQAAQTEGVQTFPVDLF